MKTIRTLLALTVLLAIVATILSCSGSADIPAAATLSAAESTEESGGESSDIKCKGASITVKLAKVKDYLDNDIGNGPNATEIEDQRGREFEFDPEPYTISEMTNSNPKVEGVMLRIKGRLVGQEDNSASKPPKLKQLLNFIEPLVKNECVTRYSFEMNPTVAPSANDVRGFEWQACPYPQIACTDGRCVGNVGECVRPKPLNTPIPKP